VIFDRLRAMSGLRSDRTAQVVIGGHAFVQNPRRGHYELAIDAQPGLRIAEAFNDLAHAI
jgi:transposase, IS6 family